THWQQLEPLQAPMSATNQPEPLPMNQSLYLGVDVAKSRLDFDAPVGRIANTPAAIAAVLSKLPAGTHLVCESTGGYETELLARTLAAAVPVSVVPPQRVRHHARSMGRLAKTD